MQIEFKLKEFKSFCGKKDAFDCAGIQGDIRRSSCGGGVGHLCRSVVRAVDQQSKDLGLNPSAAKSVFFSIQRLQIPQICIPLIFRNSTF